MGRLVYILCNLIVAFNTFKSSNAAQRGYGKECNLNENCKSYNYLICVNGVCICDVDSYTNGTDCLSYVGSDCGAFTEKYCIENSYCHRDYLQVDISDEIVTYSQAGKCKCEPDYFPIENRTCQRKQEFGECCFNGPLPCLPGFTCDSGKCNCSEENAFYDADKKVCVKIFGSCCRSDMDCPTGGICSLKKCVCQSGNHVPDISRKFCVGGHLSKCRNSSSCDADMGLVCRNGRCECQFMDHRYFDKNAEKCLGFVGGTCDNKTLVCGSNAVCLKGGKFGRSRCQCDKGFIAVDKKCDLRYGQNCSQDDDVKESPQCDRVGHVYCIDGKCQCGVRQYYDEAEFRCRGLVDSKCNLKENNFCISGAICVGVRAFDSMVKGEGICECKDGFEESEHGWCSEKRD